MVFGGRSNIIDSDIINAHSILSAIEGGVMIRLQTIGKPVLVSKARLLTSIIDTNSQLRLEGCRKTSYCCVAF